MHDIDMWTILSVQLEITLPQFQQTRLKHFYPILNIEILSAPFSQLQKLENSIQKLILFKQQGEPSHVFLFTTSISIANRSRNELIEALIELHLADLSFWGNMMCF